VDEFKEAIQDILTNYDRYQGKSTQWALEHSWQLIIKAYINVLTS